MLKFKGEGLRVLDFDLENRPLSYLGSDFTTGEITAIACKWVGEKSKPFCWLLGEHDPIEMLEGFRELYDAAGMVTGHYIRGYDLPVLNGAYLEYGLPPLDQKLSHDTKLDLIKRKYLSVSQENLGAALGLKAPKVSMNQAKWREANRLTPEGLVLTRQRAVGDVLQHIELRAKLLEIGWLKPPVLWTSSTNARGYLP